MKDETPQYITVLNYLLLVENGLTSLEALNNLGIISYPKRISEIYKHFGIVPKKTWESNTSKFGKKRFIRYSIPKATFSI